MNGNTPVTATASAEQQQPVSSSSSVASQQQPPASPKSPSTPKAKPPTSWAALLKSKNDAASKAKAASPAAQTPNNIKSPISKSSSPAVATAATSNKLSVNGGTNAILVQPPATASKFMGIADIIHRYEPRLVNASPLLEPRGLINNVNTCFMNVILQPLSHCPPFYDLLKTIGQHVVHSFRSKTPLLDSMIEFMNEFRPESASNEGVKTGPYGEPFVPEYVYDALRGQKRFDSLKVKG